AHSTRVRRRATARSVQGVEGERDGLVGGQRPAALAGCGVTVLVELVADQGARLVLERNVPAEAELLIHRFTSREDLRSRFGVSGDCQRARKAAQAPSDEAGVPELEEDARALFQQRHRLLDA